MIYFCEGELSNFLLMGFEKISCCVIYIEILIDDPIDHELIVFGEVQSGDTQIDLGELPCYHFHVRCSMSTRSINKMVEIARLNLY